MTVAALTVAGAVTRLGSSATNGGRAAGTVVERHGM